MKEDIMKYFAKILDILINNKKTSERDLSDKIDKNTSLVNDVKEYLKNEVKEINELKENEIKTLNSKIATKDSDLQNKNKQIEDTTSKLNKIEHDCSSLEQDKSRIEAENQSAKIKIGTLKNEIATKDSDLQNKNKEISELETTIDKLENTLKDYDKVFKSDKIISLLTNLLNNPALKNYRNKEGIEDDSPKSIYNLLLKLKSAKYFIDSYYDILVEYKKDNQEIMNDNEIEFYKSINKYFNDEVILNPSAITIEGKFTKIKHRDINNEIEGPENAIILIPADKYNNDKIKVEVK